MRHNGIEFYGVFYEDIFTTISKVISVDPCPGNETLIAQSLGTVYYNRSRKVRHESEN